MRKRGIIGAVAVAAAAIAVMTPGTAVAQGTITDGTVQWEYNAPIAGATSANADFRTGATDHVFQSWWWFRISGDTAETVFPTPDLQSYVGDTATLTWNNVGGRGFAAQAVDTVSDGGGGAGTTIRDLTLTNNLPQGGQLTIEIFNYIDIDLAGTAGTDSATLINANDHIGVSDGGTTAEFRGIGANAYQVTAFATLRGLLADAGVTDLNNTGLPFGPGDFTGAFQWSLVIPPQASVDLREVISVNEPAVPVELMHFSVE